MANSTNIVGVHYRVGKRIGEGSFGIIYEGNALSFVSEYVFCRFKILFIESNPGCPFLNPDRSIP
jgi:hypothetical protein